MTLHIFGERLHLHQRRNGIMINTSNSPGERSPPVPRVMLRRNAMRPLEMPGAPPPSLETTSSPSSASTITLPPRRSSSQSSSRSSSMSSISFTSETTFERPRQTLAADRSRLSPMILTRYNYTAEFINH